MPSIFKDKSVISSIPAYFENAKLPSFVTVITKLFEVEYFHTLASDTDIETSTLDHENARTANIVHNLRDMLIPGLWKLYMI